MCFCVLRSGLEANAPFLRRIRRRSRPMRATGSQLKLPGKPGSRRRRLRPIGFIRWPPSRHRRPFCHDLRVIAPCERHRLEVLHGWRGQAQRFAVSHVRCPIDGLLSWYRKAREGTRPCFKVGARLGSNTGHHDRGHTVMVRSPTMSVSVMAEPPCASVLLQRPSSGEARPGTASCQARPVTACSDPSAAGARVCTRSTSQTIGNPSSLSSP